MNKQITINNIAHFNPREYDGYTIFVVLEDKVARLSNYINLKWCVRATTNKLIDKDVSNSDFIDYFIDHYSELSEYDINAISQDAYCEVYDAMFNGKIYSIDNCDLYENCKYLIKGEPLALSADYVDKICTKDTFTKEQLEKVKDYL